MKLHIINPNATASMTETIRAAAAAVALPSTTLVAWTGIGAPASIEGYADEATALPGMLAAIARAEAEGADAHVIACFDDPGLDAAREIARGPVLGICQAGVQVAMILAKRFSIVTTLPRSVPIIEDLVAAYGAGAHCRRVRSAALPVLALEEDACRAEDAIARQIEAARDEDGAEAIVLGCAGMVDLVAALTRRTGSPSPHQGQAAPPGHCEVDVVHGAQGLARLALDHAVQQGRGHVEHARQAGCGHGGVPGHSTPP